MVVMASLQNLLRRWDAWALARRRHAELQSLDDRTLRDIGLHRSELLSIVNGSGAGRAVRD
jgi:uncharacterized protein YjiS (DUF1127 family)